MDMSFTYTVMNKNDLGIARFEAVTAVLFKILFIWFVTLCCWVCNFPTFRRIIMSLSSGSGSLGLLDPEDESITILQQSIRQNIPGNLKNLHPINYLPLYSFSYIPSFWHISTSLIRTLILMSVANYLFDILNRSKYEGETDSYLYNVDKCLSESYQS